MPRKYYCLVSGLPEISVADNKLSLTETDLKDLLAEDLTADDLVHVEALDFEDLNQQIINFLYKKEYSFEGLKYNEDDLEEFLIEVPKSAPDYLQAFFKVYTEEDNLDEIAAIKLLSSCYFNQLTRSENPFLRNWFTMELRMRNILTAITCRSYNLPVEEQIIGDDFVSIQLKENKSKDFGLAGELDYVDELLKISDEKNLLNREKMMDNLKFSKLEDELFFESFTLEAVIGFVLKFKMVNRWLKLDPETGKEMFNKIFKGVQATFEMPEAYKL